MFSFSQNELKEKAKLEEGKEEEGKIIYYSVLMATTQLYVPPLLPHKVKTQYLHFRSPAEYFLLS